MAKGTSAEPEPSSPCGGDGDSQTLRPGGGPSHVGPRLGRSQPDLRRTRFAQGGCGDEISRLEPTIPRSIRIDARPPRPFEPMARSSPPPAHTASPSDLWNSRPWAAYVLGHDAVAIELWWIVFIEVPGEEYNAEDSVPLCLDELQHTLVELVGEIKPAVSAEIQRRLGVVRTGFSGSIARTRSNSDSYLPVRWRRKAPFREERQQLLRLVDRALASANDLRPWFRLGRAVGQARLELHRGIETDLQSNDRDARQHTAASIKRLVNKIKAAASALAADAKSTIPIAGQLARLKPFTSTESTRRSFKRLVGSKNEPRLPGWPLLDNLLMNVNDRLRDQLKKLLVVEESQQDSRKPAAPQSQSRTGWTADHESRNRWIYNQDRRGTPYKAIIADLG